MGRIILRTALAVLSAGLITLAVIAELYPSALMAWPAWVWYALAGSTWKLPHVAGKPLVLAIQDFHQPRSMMWTYSGLPNYLYGYRYEPNRDECGNLVIKPIKIDRHIWGARSVPSGFFSLSGAEHISAVMFSNSGTISKFNRIGKLARFGDPNIRMIRTGEAVNLGQNAQQGVPFRREVNDA